MKRKSAWRVTSWIFLALNFFFLCLMEFSGHFLLTKLLLKKMIETAKETGVQGRVVNVSSSIHGWFAGDVIGYLGEISRNKW